MSEKKEDLLNQIVIQNTGDFETDLRHIAQTLRDNFDYIEDEAFIKALDQYLVEAYTDKADSLETILTDIKQTDDEEFMSNMKKMSQDNPTRAQFETSLFIRKMEEDFSEIRPRMYEKNISIYSPIDQFEFWLENGSEMILKPTKRDYANLYKDYARILVTSNEWREATEMYQQATLWNPYDAPAYLELAELYQNMGQYGMSYPTILSGLKHAYFPHCLAQGFYLLGQFYLSKGDTMSAYELFHLSLLWDESEEAKKAFYELMEQMPEQMRVDLTAPEVLAAVNLSMYPDAEKLAALENYINEAELSDEDKEKLIETYQHIIGELSKMK